MINTKHKLQRDYLTDEKFATIYDIKRNNLPVPKEINAHVKYFKLENDLLYHTAIPGETNGQFAYLIEKFVIKL